jgi:hypothetical protein
MIPKNKIEADKPTETTEFLPSDGAPCSDSSLMLLREECCLSEPVGGDGALTVAQLKERLSMLPPEWDSMYLTMKEMWNDDEYMKHLISPERYREKGTVNALQFYAHGDGVKHEVLGVRILEHAESHAILGDTRSTSPFRDPFV